MKNTPARQALARSYLLNTAILNPNIAMATIGSCNSEYFAGHQHMASPALSHACELRNKHDVYLYPGASIRWNARSAVTRYIPGKMMSRIKE